MTLAGSFVPKTHFWLFLVIRSLVGIGEASYSCIAPTLIGDLFTSELRTKMLAFFYIAVPVGSGLGFIVGSNVAHILGEWQWALRVTPPLGAVCILLLVFIVKEPKRGGAEGHSMHEASNNQEHFFKDILYLLKNKTFMWITLGFTFASFVLGGVSWWVPTYVQYAIKSKNEEPVQIPLLFGVVTVFSGLIGVSLSSMIAPKLRAKYSYADPLICALGSLITIPTLFLVLVITRSANAYLFWFIVAIAVTAMCLAWTIVADILLYVIYPNKRSIASAVNILISHLLGDAGSPYIIGAISKMLRQGQPDTYMVRYQSLQMALYAGPCFALLSFGAYLFAAIYIDEDRKNVDLYIKKSQKSMEATEQPQISQPQQGITNPLVIIASDDNLASATSQSALVSTPQSFTSPFRQNIINQQQHNQSASMANDGYYLGEENASQQSAAQS
jgi:MFS family permease